MIMTIQVTVSLASFITVPNARMGVPVGSPMHQTRRANGMHCEDDSFRCCVVIVTGCVFRGRNVCRYYLFGVCKFGERCSYLHSKEYLSQQGWWSTAEGIDQERGHYNKTSKKRQPKKNRDIRARPGLWGSDAGVTDAKNFSLRAPSASTIGQSSQGAGMKNKRNPTFYSYSSSGEYDSDGDDDMAMCGFTGSQVAELVCHGVKPWDDDAWVHLTRPAVRHACLRFRSKDVLDALREF